MYSIFIYFFADADTRKDTKSLKRALDSHLLLLIEQKLGLNYKWICPQIKWEEGETMRQVKIGKGSL